MITREVVWYRFDASTRTVDISVKKTVTDEEGGENVTHDTCTISDPEITAAFESAAQLVDANISSTMRKPVAIAAKVEPVAEEVAVAAETPANA